VLEIESIQPFTPNISALGSFFGLSRTNSTDDHIMPIVETLLPNSALLGEVSATGIAVTSAVNFSTRQFLNMTMFVLSNNFLGPGNGKKIYEWLKVNGSTAVLDTLLTIEEPTAQAALEGVFQLAVLANDVPIVKYLATSGINPNGSTCKCQRTGCYLAPLQWALVNDKHELAEELLNAGAQVDYSDSGSTSNALVLAIVGTFAWYSTTRSLNDPEFWNAKCHSLLNLACILLDAGCAVNPVLAMRDDSDQPIGRFVHTPLTAASKYRSLELVNLFIERGADVTTITFLGTSALHNCIFSWEEFSWEEFIREEFSWEVIYNSMETGNRGLCDRKEFFWDSKNVSKICDVIDALVSHGADPNLLGQYGIVDKQGVYQTMKQSPIDLAVLQGSNELIRTLLLAGATVTWRTLKHAIEMDDERMFENILATLDMPSFGKVEYEPLVLACCRSGNMQILQRVLNDEFKNSCGLQKSFGAAIHTAVYNGGEDLIDTLLVAGADINATFRDDSTALLEAVRRCNETLIRKLVNAGANVNHLVYCNCTHHKSSHISTGAILIAAIEWGNPTVIDLLLKGGAAIDGPGRLSAPEKWTNRCITPLTAAISEHNWSLVADFLATGAAVNNPPGLVEHHSPLSTALSCGNFGLVKYLLDKNARAEEGNSLLVAFRDVSVLDFLLRGLESRASPPVDRSLVHAALNFAISQKNIPATYMILQSKLTDSTILPAALLSAVRGEDNTISCQLMHLILDAGAEPNYTLWNSTYNDEDERKWRTSTLTYAVKSSTVKVELLLGRGAQPNGVFGEDTTPLQWSTMFTGIETVHLLLKYGADPNVIGHKSKDTPLQNAAREGHKEMVELLLEHGAEINAAPARRHGATALQFAAMKGYLGIAHLLLESGADVNALPAEEDGRTALEGAAEWGRIDMVQMLLNAGAHVEDDNGYYDQAMERAVENGHFATKRLLEAYRGRIS
jgi:ankyrin repeat protein